MPTTLTGDASTVSNALSRTVTGATNASPIVITTSASHLFATGDTVQIASVGGNTAANGTFVITKLSATTFSLDGSTGNGAYTSGGTAVDVCLTPQFTVPADGDTLDAASVNAALEALADRTQFLALISRMRSKEYTANGTFTSPANCMPIGIAVGYGAGGGGGGASPASTTNSDSGCGGGGGGSAQQRVRLVSLSPSTAYTVTIGAGGAGGAASTAGSAGSDSTFDTLATFAGGGGGTSSSDAASASSKAVRGGLPVAGPSPYAGMISVVNRSDLVGTLGHGGAGLNAIAAVDSHAGFKSAEGYAGGAGGAYGATVAGGVGGGGGGGGAGGPGGAGGAGGAGGDGNGMGSGLTGSNGTAAAANTGAGGGGGGAGGTGSAGAGTAGTGGAGGSGKIVIYWFGDPV